MKCPTCNQEFEEHNQEFEEQKIEVDWNYKVRPPAFNSDVKFEDFLKIVVNGQIFSQPIITIVKDEDGILSPLAYRRRLEKFGMALQNIGHNIELQAKYGHPMVDEQAGALF